MHSWPFNSLGGFDKAWEALGAISFQLSTKTTTKTHPKDTGGVNLDASPVARLRALAPPESPHVLEFGAIRLRT